jgi:hypothetical protein
MHLIQILLPLHDAKGRGFPKAKYEQVTNELTEKFGGVTAFTRTPAEGRWKPGGGPASEDDIVVVEVMTAGLDSKWWGKYRKALEKGFKQESIVVRAQDIELL